MERECKRCGRLYRGLVCHACNPRRKKSDVAAAVDVGGELAGGAVLEKTPVPGDVSPVKTDGEA